MAGPGEDEELSNRHAAVLTVGQLGRGALWGLTWAMVGVVLISIVVLIHWIVT